MLVIGIVVRFFHFGELLDSPHTWRQADTANYVYDFYTNGLDLFHPSVCWMGNHKTLLLEFPLPEAIASIGYHIFGESHVIIRLVFFLFFLGAVLFFYKIVDLVASKKTAQVASLIFLFIPLSLFFSRAVHIDFTALFFVHAGIYWLMKGYQKKNFGHLLIASLMCTLAILIKVPYLFYFSIPVIWFVWKEKRLKYFLKTFFLYLIPLGCFALWQYHSHSLNSSAPDWEYVIGYRKFDDNSLWYFGDLKQRLSAENWLLLGERMHSEILGWTGLALGVFGLIMSIIRKHWFSILWLAGTFVYVLIFFNLNVVHNYYQIPFVSISAVFIAVGILQVGVWLKKWKQFTIILLCLLFAGESIYYSEANYYIVQTEQIEIGELIKTNTNQNDLVMINYANYDSKCPNFLYRARRNGWQIMDYGIEGSILYRLMKEGANKFATVRSSTIEGEIGEFLKVFPVQTLDLNSSNKRVYLYDLDVNHIWESMPDEEREAFSRISM